MRKRQSADAQLSLFEVSKPDTTPFNTTPKKDATVLDFLRSRFENGPEMTQEEYRRWIKVLVNRSLKRLD